jgi:hypothetical protein
MRESIFLAGQGKKKGTQTFSVTSLAFALPGTISDITSIRGA